MPNKLKRCIDFEYVELNRSEIDEAPYNPRKIKDKNRSNLRGSIKRFGMVESIIVNKRSQEKGWEEGSRYTLVGGHQRLALLDEKNKTDQYIIGVNLIDVGEVEEKALNLALNNKNLQGEYDQDLLKMLADDGVDLEKDGYFDKVDMEMMFGFDDEVAKSLVDGDFRAAMKRNEVARDKQDDADVNYDRTKDKKKKTIIFETNRAALSFEKLLDIEPDSAFIRGEMLVSIITEWRSLKEASK